MEPLTGLSALAYALMVAYYGKKAYAEYGVSVDDIKKNLEYFTSHSFLDERLITWMLWKCDLRNLKNTGLLNYSAWTTHYENEKKIRYEVRRANDRQDRELPYSELINFMEHPNTRIWAERPVARYKMPGGLRLNREQAYQAHKAAKPNSTDGPTIRIADFRKRDDGDYDCIVERASHYDQARTNLTLDFVQPGLPTLRKDDESPSKTLPTFEQSALVNSIGVSAVVSYVEVKTGRRKFFTKLRKKEEAVFEKMLGSTSGVAQLVDGQPVWELLTFAAADMMREFQFESGIDVAKGRVKRLVPLALVRELTRAGKPQFFFLIETEELDPKEFKADFRNSLEGMKEFHTERWAEIFASGELLSPEFATNLVYALRFLSREVKESEVIDAT